MTKKLQILHNPRCGKSRGAVEIACEQGYQPEIREYLKAPLSEEELRKLLQQLQLPAEDLIRKKEKEFQLNFSQKALSEEDCIQAILSYPILMERPIAILGKKAIICRPSEKILELLETKK